MIAKKVVIKEKIITATSPIFIFKDALFLFIRSFLFNSMNTGIATAGKIIAWKTIENTIKTIGLCSRNIDPNANNNPVPISTLYIGD